MFLEAKKAAFSRSYAAWTSLEEKPTVKWLSNAQYGAAWLGAMGADWSMQRKTPLMVAACVSISK